jgi:predicted anti-sigma-YlaC factor YlaD
MNDDRRVRCTDCQQELSARLDGEDDPDARVAVDAHLASCPDCGQWYEYATRISRLARLDVARPTPDLTDAVLARSRADRSGRWRMPLRWALAFVGFCQLVLALAQILGDGVAGYGAQINGATMLHFAHESAAWSIAIGFGFIWIARLTSKASGLLPTLTAVIAVLTVLTGVDILHHQVDIMRVMSHLLLVVGYLIVVVFAWPRTGGGGSLPRAQGDRDHPETVGSGRYESSRPGTNKGDGSSLRPTARHDAA